MARRRQSPRRSAVAAAAGHLPDVVSMAPFLILAVVHLLAHFIPFERAALSMDSLARLSSLHVNPPVIFKELLAIDRPLEVFHYLIFWMTGEDTFLWAAMVFITSTLLLWAVYGVLRCALDHPGWAFVGALFYSLIPNKLELYYTLDYSNHNAFSAAYLLSFVFFALFMRRERWFWLALSLLSYTTAIFWNELGFFLPGVLLVYAFLIDRRKVWAALLFLAPALLYASWRLGAFVPPEPAAPPLRFDLFLSHVFVQAPHLYMGRQMAKAVLYGFYRFAAIDFPWIGLLLTADIFFIAWGLRAWRRTSFPPLGVKPALLSTALFLLLFIPGLLNWGVTGRNTALAAAGFSGLAMVLISRLKKSVQFPLLIGLFGLGLLVSQGTAWSQVEACRINQAIYQTLFQNKREIIRSERVLVDQYSFAQKIPYTWVEDPHNQLDTYWGVGALLAGKGYPLLVHVAIGEQKPVSIVRSPIEQRGDSFYFKIYNMDTYSLEERTVPVAGSFLIDYNAVYSGSHKRVPPGVKAG